MKKIFHYCLCLCCLSTGMIYSESKETIPPQTVIDKAEETFTVLSAKKGELSATYNRLIQQIQRLQFQANTYPSDTNQLKAELTQVAGEYDDVLQTMIMLKQLEIDAYDTQLRDQTLTRSKKTKIRTARNQAMETKETLTKERNQLLREGFVQKES